MRIYNRRSEGGYSLIDAVVAVAILVALSVGFYVIYSKMTEGAKKEAAERGELSPDVTTAPSPAPVVDVAPPDLTWLWIGLGALGAIVALAIAAFVIFNLTSRARYNSLELKEKREAIAEDRRQALAIWQKFVAKHQELKEKVLQAETDWDMLFSYPALVDASVPQTREFHRALRAADSHSSEPPAELSLAMAIGDFPYPQLVEQAEAAWQSAWSFAKSAGTTLIPRDERKKIDQIVKLLKLARDGGGSEHERAIAYSRAEKLIAELHFVKVPEAAMKAISAEARLMIEARAAESAVPPREADPVALAL